MAKIDITNNKMAMFMLCEAIGQDRDVINVQELNVERFIENLYRSYQNEVKKQATDLLSMEYDKMLKKIYEIQEALEHHNKIFDEKVYSF